MTEFMCLYVTITAIILMVAIMGLVIHYVRKEDSDNDWQQIGIIEKEDEDLTDFIKPQHLIYRHKTQSNRYKIVGYNYTTTIYSNVKDDNHLFQSLKNTFLKGLI